MSPLEGSWQTGSIALKETEATVRRHGLGRYVEEYRENAPFLGETVLTLTVENGAWDLYGKSGSGQPAPIDYDAEYEIDGDAVVFHHSDGSNTYRWEIERNILTLHFVQSTLPGSRGIPNECPGVRCTRPTRSRGRADGEVVMLAVRGLDMDAGVREPELCSAPRRAELSPVWPVRPELEHLTFGPPLGQTPVLLGQVTGPRAAP